MDNKQYSVISEQGDLGLFNTPLNQQDNQTYQEALNQQQQSSSNQQTQVIAEEKKD